MSGCGTQPLSESRESGMNQRSSSSQWDVACRYVFYHVEEWESEL